MIFMNNNKNEVELEKLKLNIAAYNFKDELQKSGTLRKQRKGVNIMKKKIIATACASLILVSGIVVATSIKKSNDSDRGLGDGINNAVESGYVANPNAEGTDNNSTIANTELSNINAKITIEDFLMDDVNLSTQILFEFDNKIKDAVNLDKVISIELTDLIVRDEENRIIYGGNNEERFKKYCKENNLNYTFCEFNENYMNCGVNCFNVMKDKESNSIKIMYNMYTSDTYPKSKKLYFSFQTIMFNELVMSKEKKLELKGNWEITVDVPENMYTRTDEYYKVISCDNPDFNIYIAKLTNTGFEIGVIISNIEKPEEDVIKKEDFLIALENYQNGKISKDEYDKKALWNKEYNDLLTPIQVTDYNYTDGKSGKASYVENENGKRFKFALSPARRAKTYFIDGNKYDFYETFGMTKYDATNKIKVILYYYGEPVTIALEKL